MLGMTHKVENLTAGQLRQFIESHREDEYLLIDVCEPEEYQDEHIPGATLVPLMELELGRATLGSADTEIFYCRSGGRFQRGDLAAPRA